MGSDQSPFTSTELTFPTGYTGSVSFSHKSNYVLACSSDGITRLWDLTKSPITSQELTCHKCWVTSVAFSPDGRFISTGLRDTIARLWKIKSIDSTKLALEDGILLAKSVENEDSLKDDVDALERLQLMMKEPTQQSEIIKLITDHLYRIKLPEKECWICSEKYDPETRVCMQLPCCQKSMCKVCLDKLGGMSYLAEFEGYQFEIRYKTSALFAINLLARWALSKSSLSTTRVSKGIIMLNRTTFFSISFVLMMATPSHAMQMAARQSEHDSKKMDEHAAKELAAKLLGKEVQ